MAPHLDPLVSVTLAGGPLGAGLWIAALTLLGVVVLPWAREEALRTLDAWRAVWPTPHSPALAFTDPLDLLPAPLPATVRLAPRRPNTVRRDPIAVPARRS